MTKPIRLLASKGRPVDHKLNQTPGHWYRIRTVNLLLIQALLTAVGTGLAQAGVPSSSDDNWDRRFGFSGIISSSSSSGMLGFSLGAVAFQGTNIFVGGNFQAIGQTLANSIAWWDGSQWHSLGQGIQAGSQNLGVLAIATLGTNVFVGGNFSVAGNQYANGIARWDGSSWHALGEGIYNGVQDPRGIPSTVSALLVVGGDLYVGGSFAKAGGINSPGIAKWNGSSWSPVGTGVSGTVDALATDGTNIYAGGYLPDFGCVAKWNGAAWSALGSGLTWESFSISYDIYPSAYSLAFFGTNLYATGFFNTAVSLGDTPGIAKWDGTKWSSPWQTTNGFLASGVYDGGDALLSITNALYLTGSFVDTNGLLQHGLAHLNDYGVWEVVADGIGTDSTDEQRAARFGDGSIHLNVIASDGRRFVIGGQFSRVNDQNASGLVRWSGQGLLPFNDGGGFPLEYCSALASDGTNLFAGVQGQAGGVLVNGVARWDGTNWSTLGLGLEYFDNYYGTLDSGWVSAIAASGQSVYVGGSFDIAGIDYANNVAKWDGTNWSALGDDINNGITMTNTSGLMEINAIAITGSNVYAGGFFDTAGGLPAASIARWDGSVWSALGSGVSGYYGPYGTVEAMAVGRDGLYVAGEFTDAGGVSCSSIARWDGIAWHSLNESGQDAIYDVREHKGQIYVAGNGGVGKWDGTNWFGFSTAASMFGNGGWSLYIAYSIAFDGDDLYVSGDFLDSSGNRQGGCLAKWTGDTWLLLGHGIAFINNSGQMSKGIYNPLAIEIIGKSLFVGGKNGSGSFEIAGNVLSHNIARYDLGFDFSGLRIKSINHLQDGTVQCFANGINANIAYLEATADFSKWIRVDTNSSIVNNSAAFIDPGAPQFNRRFYRVTLP